VELLYHSLRSLATGKKMRFAKGGELSNQRPVKKEKWKIITQESQGILEPFRNNEIASLRSQ